MLLLTKNLRNSTRDTIKKNEAVVKIQKMFVQLSFRKSRKRNSDFLNPKFFRWEESKIIPD